MSIESQSDILDAFAIALVRKVRDEAIRASDKLAGDRSVGPQANRWKEALRDSSAATAVTELIPDIVDQTIFQLLAAIDGADLDLLYRSETGEVVGLSEEGRGELGGWFIGDDGWRSRFANERYVKQIGDLRLNVDWDTEA